jgi:arginyl-tRNA synthetase
LLDDAAELNHISVLLRWPEQALRIMQSPSSIHHLVSYARAISTSFHAWWNAGMEHQSKRFVVPGNPALSAARMALVGATQQTLEIIMSILGVKPLSQLDKLED